MKFKIYTFLFILSMVALLGLSSCQRENGEAIVNPTLTMMVANDINPKIEIHPWYGMPQTQKAGDMLGFQVKNLSSETIVFATDFGTKIYKKQGTNWIPVENGQGYPEVENILPPNDVNPGGLALFVFPQLENIKTSTTVRIEISGHVQNKSANIVSTYIDVLYNP